MSQESLSLAPIADTVTDTAHNDNELLISATNVPNSSANHSSNTATRSPKTVPPTPRAPIAVFSFKAPAVNQVSTPSVTASPATTSLTTKLDLSSKLPPTSSSSKVIAADPSHSATEKHLRL